MLSDSAVKTVLYLRNVGMAIQPPGFMMIPLWDAATRKLRTQNRLDREL